MDDEKAGENRRGSLLEQINDNFNDAVISVYTGEDVEKRSDIDWEDPFFAAVKRGEAEQVAASIEPPVHLPTTTTDYDIDQGEPG